jgi:hypothetical protein
MLKNTLKTLKKTIGKEAPFIAIQNMAVGGNFGPTRSKVGHADPGARNPSVQPGHNQFITGIHYWEPVW